MERLRRIADEYDDRGGGADTLQGALANAIVLLRSEANRNGLLNWGENYEECIRILLKYLCDDSTALPVSIADEMRRDLTLIREVGLRLRSDYATGYEQVDRVAERVLHWCEAHPRPILKPSAQDFWYP
jgi:hypothetical protein